MYLIVALSISSTALHRRQSRDSCSRSTSARAIPHRRHPPRCMAVPLMPASIRALADTVGMRMPMLQARSSSASQWWARSATARTLFLTALQVGAASSILTTRSRTSRSRRPRRASRFATSVSSRSATRSRPSRSHGGGLRHRLRRPLRAFYIFASLPSCHRDARRAPAGDG